MAGVSFRGVSASSQSPSRRNLIRRSCGLSKSEYNGFTSICRACECKLRVEIVYYSSVRRSCCNKSDNVTVTNIYFMKSVCDGFVNQQKNS